MAATRKTVKLHLYDLIAALVFLGRPVSPEDIAHHLYTEVYGDIDKYDILNAVKDALARELAAQAGVENHYGLCEKSGTYWLNYSVGLYR